VKPKNKTLAWMVAALTISYLPWYNFSAVLSFLAEEYALTAIDTGAIISAFQAGYVITVIMTGWLADRIGARRVVLSATLVTAVSSSAFAFVVSDKWTVMVMRLVTGCACGGIYAPGMALLSDWFPPSKRGAALGAYTAASCVASAGGYFLAGPVAAASGWRLGMLVTSLPVFAAFLIVLLCVREAATTDAPRYDGPQRAPGGGFGGLALITASYMGHMWELYAFWAWIGPFLVACAMATGMTVVEAVRLGGFLAAIITLVGAPAVWIMGRLADAFGRTKTICLCAMASLLPEFVIGFLYGLPLSVIVPVGVWIGFWVVADSAIYKASLTELCASRIRTTLLGLQSAIGYSMTIFAPIIFGWVLQRGNTNANPTEATHWGPAFFLLGLGALLAPAAAMALRRHPQAVLLCGGKK
jgi:MFS family permease